MMRLIRRRPAFVLGIAVTLFLVAVALLSLVWTPVSPTKIQIAQKLKSPFAYGGLGTDHFGRDVLSMLMAGHGIRSPPPSPPLPSARSLARRLAYRSRHCAVSPKPR